MPLKKCLLFEAFEAFDTFEMSEKYYRSPFGRDKRHSDSEWVAKESLYFPDADLDLPAFTLMLRWWGKREGMGEGAGRSETLGEI